MLEKYNPIDSVKILKVDLFSFAIKKHDYSGLYIGGDLDFQVRSSGSKTTNQMIEYSLAGKK